MYLPPAPLSDFPSLSVIHTSYFSPLTYLLTRSDSHTVSNIVYNLPPAPLLSFQPSNLPSTSYPYTTQSSYTVTQHPRLICLLQPHNILDCYTFYRYTSLNLYMDSGMQSPDMANPYLATDPFHPGSGGLPLAGSMHAMVPHSYLPVIPQPPNPEVAMTRQLDNRVSRLEQQQFQDGVNAHFRGVQMSQALQHLQQQFHQMQHAITFDLPALRLQVQALEAKLDRKENDDCTRQIQLKPRSQEQRIQSAMRNPNLMRISISKHVHATLEQLSIYRAEQMEALAASLRGRVHRGGAAYLLEAEDAEAWASKLREDAKNIGQPTDNMLLENDEFKSKAAKSFYLDIDAYLDAEEAKLQAEKAREELYQFSAPTQNTINEELAVTAQPISAKDSTHTDTPASQHFDASNASTSAVSIKIEESSNSHVSPVQVEAVPDLQTKKLAPHLRYATQPAQESKELTQEIEGTTKDDILQTQQVAVVTEAKVPSRTLPPHRRLFKRADTPPTSKSEASPTTKSDIKSSTREIEESTASGVIVPRAPSDVFKDEVSAAGEKVFSVKAVPARKPKKGDSKRDASKKDEFISPLDLNTSVWQPTYLKDLPLLSPSELDDIPPPQQMHTFSRTFLLNHLGGARWLPSFYHIPSPELSLLPGRGFYLFEDTAEPVAPSQPGQHGSLVTPILRLPESNNPSTPKPEAMHNAPLFIKRGDRYVYYGMYTHLRSDRLDLERCNALIPDYLKEHWATQLTLPNRPKWVTSALQHHLRAPPSFSLPSSSTSSEDAAIAMSHHHQALSSWHRDTAIKTSFLRPSHILTAFSSPDTGNEIPGLRFWCLGLKCEGWDKGFYQMMKREEKVWEKEGRRDGEKEREKRGRR
jgi:hypothetical protein